MSSLISSLVVPMIILTAMVFSFDFTKGEDVPELELFCNPKINGDNSDEARNLLIVMTSLVNETPVAKGFFQRLTYQGYYGIATCNGVISEAECADCLDYARDEIYINCGFADGAQLKLVNCGLRFEHSPFS